MRDAGNLMRWSRMAAAELVSTFSRSAAIDTADYKQVSFIIAAAKLAMHDDAFAEQVAKLMEVPRKQMR